MYGGYFYCVTIQKLMIQTAYIFYQNLFLHNTSLWFSSDSVHHKGELWGSIFSGTLIWFGALIYQQDNQCMHWMCVCVRARMCVREGRTRRNSRWSCYWRSWCWTRPRWRRSGRLRQRWWTVEKHIKAQDSRTTPILRSSSEWGQTHPSPRYVSWRDGSTMSASLTLAVWA